MIDGNTKFSDLLEEDSNSLKHYGVKGMKWGVRKDSYVKTSKDDLSKMSNEEVKAKAKRMENEKKIRDLATPESKRSKAIESLKVVKEGTESLDRSLANIDNIKGKPVYKKYNKMSDEELNKQVSRLSREHQLSDLRGDTKFVKSGKEKTREVLQTVGAVLSTALTGALIFEIIRRNKK